MESWVDLAAKHGCPFYLYDETGLAAQLSRLRAALPDFDVLYSVKTNPHPAVCRFLSGAGAGVDAASAGEVEHALVVGFPADRIYYSAPGKSEKDLHAAFGSCVLIADSYPELERINSLAAEVGRVESVGLRINPDFAFGPGPCPELRPGAASKFGVDEEGLAARKEFIASLKNVRLCGFHIFLRSQVLSHSVLLAYCRHIFSLARTWVGLFGQGLDFINFGGGFGVASGEWKTPLDLDCFGMELKKLVAEQKTFLPAEVGLFIESGRFLVAEAGTFITRIEDVKESRGTCFAIVPGALNGFLRPAVMTLLGGLPTEVNGPLEPLYSNSSTHHISLPGGAGRPEKRVSVVGNLCTSLDLIAKDVLLPEPRVGDILLVSQAGAYGATLSPWAFAGFPRPPELYRDREGRIVKE
jgi:diaminopimelate decarboxylase